MPDTDVVPRWLLGERRQPTVEAMLGAVGGLVALFGATALYGEVPDDGARAAGIALALLTLLVGVLLPALHPGRAAAAAGVALSAGAVLPLAFLVANDPETLDSKGDFLVAAVLAVLLWLALFAVGPARGHSAFLGLALFGLWLGALSQTSPEMLFLPFRPGVGFEREIPSEEVPFGTVPTRPFDTRTLPTFDTIPPPSFRFDPPPTFQMPQPSIRFPRTTSTTGQSLGRASLVSTRFDHDEFDEPRPPVAPAVLSLLFGAAYLFVGAALDRSRVRRAAAAFLTAGIPALLVGSALVGPRLGATAAGLVGLVAGGAVVAVGIIARRRFVAWLGAAGLAVGVAAVVGSVFDDSAGAAAVLLLVIGAAVVGAGVLAAERYPSADADAD